MLQLVCLYFLHLIYRGHAAENLGYMRKIVLKLLQDETSCTDGIAAKRMRAALNTRYLR